ncbi:MAG: DUF2283 domain-containing protein [Thermoflexus sp.]|nr:DUF2283 domain-containing protein [Thermoflexus sp.]
MYVSFGDPLPATESEPTDEDIIVRYRRGRVIGYTILHARRRSFLQGRTDARGADSGGAGRRPLPVGRWTSRSGDRDPSG